MSDKVVCAFGDAPAPEGEPREDIAEMLKFVSERAMRGELVNCVIIAIAKKEIMDQVFDGEPRPLMSSDR